MPKTAGARSKRAKQDVVKRGTQKVLGRGRERSAIENAGGKEKKKWPDKNKRMRKNTAKRHTFHAKKLHIGRRR